MDTVLLGFIDQPISDTAAVSWDTNKIGGSPVSTNPCDDTLYSFPLVNVSFS